MRLLHTSDLHLGMVWRGVPRWDDQERVLNEVLDLCDAHNVDLLLITGDVFADRVQGGHARLARRFLERLRDQLQKGRAVLLLRGNHDPLDLFQLMRLLAVDLAGDNRWPLIIADLPGVYTVPGHDLQIIALPYVAPSFLQTLSISADVSREDRITGLAGLLAAYMPQLYQKITPGCPAIFAGHVQIAGVAMTDEFEGDYRRELWLDPGTLPQFTSYNALGHIHRSQAVSGVGKPTWYAGAPERLDVGERNYVPQVLLVNTPETPGGYAEVQPIPLTCCTPFVRVELDGEEAVARFCEDTANPVTLGIVTIAGVPAGTRGIIEEQIHAAAPRIAIQWALEDLDRPPEAEHGPDPHDVFATVRSFLDRAYADRPEHRAQLLDAFASLSHQEEEDIA